MKLVKPKKGTTMETIGKALTALTQCLGQVVKAAGTMSWLLCTVGRCPEGPGSNLEGFL